MSFATEASKLLTNKYFLYFMVFLAATNVLGYLVTNKINAVIFFALVSLLTYQFSKNMAVVLLIATIATNFLMANKKMREGLDNQTGTTESTETTEQAPALSRLGDKDPELGDAIANPAFQDAKTNAQVTPTKRPVAAAAVAASNDTIQKPTQPITKPDLDINNPGMNSSSINGEGESEVEPFGDKMGNGKNNKKGSSGPRLDYAATIEQSYSNLDSLLGSDSIKQLTTDTQKLMKQQQNLFDTMQNMVPVLQGAQQLLKDFKIDGLTDSLKSMGGLAGAPIAATNK
jgi:hypothetical protein